MKIAMIGHKRVPSREGGIEVVVEKIATRMAERGHSVELYNRSGCNVADSSIKAYDKKEYKGMRLLTIPTMNNRKLNAIIYSFNASVRALFGGYDVIHYHAEGPCSMMWIPHMFGIRTVATIHGLDWQRDKWGRFASWYLRFGERMAVRCADEIIVLSRNVQQYFKDTYNRDVNYIPNGVGVYSIKPVDIINEAYGLEKEKYILFLARIVPEKGLHYLIEAYKTIDTDIPLVIAGGQSHTGEYYEQIKEMVKNDKRIIMTGFLQGGRMLSSLSSNCLVYVLPSDVEGMPLSLIEMLSYGRKCLVSDIPENKELIRGYGTTFAHGNVSSLREKLIEAIESDSKNNMAAIEYIRQNYDWDKITAKTLALYKETKLHEPGGVYD